MLTRAVIRWLGAAAGMVIAACGGGAVTTPALAPRDTTPLPPAVLVIPSIGAPDVLDVATWNVEWFGDPGNGPTDEARQLANVRTVIGSADVDVWGLQEVVSVPAFRSMLAAMPGYDGVVATDSTVQDGRAWYSDVNDTEQKVALVWRSNVASLLSARVILTESNFDFAGRPPVEFRLRVSLGGRVDTMPIVVLHAKAGSDTASYQRRVAAAAALKGWVERTWGTRPVWIIGDLNDDLDASITLPLASPYAPFVRDTTRWTAATLGLSLARVPSTLTYPDIIDHQLVTRAAAGRLVADSPRAWRLDAIVPSYRTTTSDHLPVVVRYRVP